MRGMTLSADYFWVPWTSDWMLLMPCRAYHTRTKETLWNTLWNAKNNFSGIQIVKTILYNKKKSFLKKHSYYVGFPQIFMAWNIHKVQNLENIFLENVCEWKQYWSVFREEFHPFLSLKEISLYISFSCHRSAHFNPLLNSCTQLQF